VNKKSNPKAIGLLAFGVLALGGGATYFQYNSVQKVKAEVVELESQVPSQKDLEHSLADSKSKLVSYQEKLAHLEGSVPDVAYIPTLLKELESMGIGHGIVVTGVRPAPIQATPALPREGEVKQEKKSYSEVEIEIKGRGRYDDIKKFLDALQKFPKVIAVKTVSLSPIRESSSNSIKDIEAVINVVAYVFPFDLLTASSPQPMQGSGGSNLNPLDAPVITDSGEKMDSTTSSVTETHKLANPGGRD
jgi:Tfp pilus assembly protein PilO